MSALSERLKLAKGTASIYDLEERARKAHHPLHAATIAKYINDEGAQKPPERTVRGLAAAFDIPPGEIRRLIGMPAGDDGPWVPPEESARLNREQREALSRLIKAIVRGEQAVAESLAEMAEAVEGHEMRAELDSAEQVGETRAFRRRRGPGPRRQPRRKDANYDATQPPTDKPIQPSC